jgi:hypothetical protein
LAHQKTIEAYKAAGIDWKFFEKGHDIVQAERRRLIESDPKKTVVVNNVYRIRIDDGTSEVGEFILWDQMTTGRTEIGNKVEYYESPSDLCMWFEPTGTKEVRFNAELQKMETLPVMDDNAVKTHYLYPFNKENIAMIEKLTKNNRKCNFAVKDNTTGRGAGHRSNGQQSPSTH